jgi:MinD superfamily P-loop ATPase
MTLLARIEERLAIFEAVGQSDSYPARYLRALKVAVERASRTKPKCDGSGSFDVEFHNRERLIVTEKFECDGCSACDLRAIERELTGGGE